MSLICHLLMEEPQLISKIVSLKLNKPVPMASITIQASKLVSAIRFVKIPHSAMGMAKMKAFTILLPKSAYAAVLALILKIFVMLNAKTAL